MLKDYRMMQINIINMEKEIEYLSEQDGITGIECGDGSGGSGGFKSVTERTALRNIDEIEKLRGKIRLGNLEIETINRLLDGLTETERQIIKVKYIDGLPWWQVAYSVGYSEKHAQKIRRRSINKMVVGVYGKQCSESESI